MGKVHGWLPTACGLLFAFAAGLAGAQRPPEAGAAPAAAPAFGAPVTVYAGTREVVWILFVPVLTTETVPVVVTVPELKLRGRRWDYDYPGLKSQRFKLGQVAEFNCKYMDWGLPEQCHTVWRNVYADLPVLAMEHDHLNYDAAEWVWAEKTIHLDVPRWSWHESTFTLSVPSFGPNEVEQAQATLDAQQAAAASAIDAGIATLDRSIAAVEAQGADPHRVAQAGASIDLPALRQSLRDEQARELQRVAVVRDELRNLGSAVTASTRPAAAP